MQDKILIAVVAFALGYVVSMNQWRAPTQTDPRLIRVARYLFAGSVAFALLGIATLIAGCSSEPNQVGEWRKVVHERCSAMRGSLSYNPDTMTAECFRNRPFMMPVSMWRVVYPESPT